MEKGIVPVVEPVGVYISVPFCKAKCSFCNFASDAFGAERMEAYVDRLCDEIVSARTKAASVSATLSEKADTVYFGGGTPSLLAAAQFRRIFDCLRKEFAFSANAEITLECAPGQLADETLDELLKQGMNRISFGVQSFVDQESAAVGRLHTRQQCEDEVARVGAAGVGEVNLDLIAGLPYQTEASWRFSLDQAIHSGVPHLSVYMFEVDEDSRLGKEVLRKGSRYHAAAVPSEDEMAEWYQQACGVFEPAGMDQYEISNFAHEGHCSRHNLKYWRRQPYIGFGLDAHSMLPTEAEAVRFANTDDLDAYIGGPFAPRAAVPEVEVISTEQAFEESLFLGLRLNEGVKLDGLRSQFGEAMVRSVMPALLECEGAGLIEMKGRRVRLTARGRIVSNEVFSRLLVEVAG
ncbi:radical SAM family heme chaperone HemW [Edaphobacter sp.]|uniref:radical SAM family heme chaperone HemW n=1 Tax=Edaphobacter sp. TaxID=1934404 RepID=UPI002DBB8CBD|nr:radical SAM family heme chaperone HemW [Edaphobacter sp.]HEU5340944.1 radical SAM family heme chaperone HemW [Edaphobacter sp.]